MYAQIAARIAARIDAGELRPGDLVPSARQITRDFGVAIATATKVLARLRDDGRVQVRPGVGTIVTPVAPRPPTGGGELSRDQIVRAAVRIADEEGLAALSMRRVASSLDAATMSLYRHVRGKDELILYMIDTAIATIPLPPRPAHWRAALETVARVQWRGFNRHPWLAPMLSMTRPQLAPNALAHGEYVMRALDGLGLPPGDRLLLHVTLFGFVRGLATSLETEAEAQRETGLTNDEWMDAQMSALHRQVGTGAMAAMIRDVSTDPTFDLDLDLMFEFGLLRLMDGFETFVNRR